MKKKLLLTTSLLVVATMLFASINVGAITASRSYDTIKNTKIETHLAEKLSKMNDDDKIDVSIWVDDVDHKKVEEKTRKEILSLSEKGEVSTDVLVLLDDVKSYSELAEKGVKEPSQEDTQALIETKRMLYKKEYLEHNKKMLNAIYEDSKDDEKFEPEYIGHYAPNFTACLSKSQIYALCDLQYVTKVFVNQPKLSQIKSSVDSSSISRSASSYDTFNTYKDDTGITSLNNINHGSGIKIGLLEFEGVPNKNLSCFSSAVNNNRISIIGNSTKYTSHASSVAAIILGRYGSFNGVAYDVSLYCDYVYNYANNGVKYGAEALMDQGVNIINMSFAVWNDVIPKYNEYGDISYWIDHIANMHNVHVVMASGNTGSSGVTNGNMAYNAIVVGATEIVGDIYYEVCSFSSYCTDSDMQYKPDLLAPGQSLELPSGLGTFSGTSAATPMVSGALAMLIKTNSYMKLNPNYAKSALLAGTDRLTKNSTQNSTALNQIAMIRNKGAGMMNIYNSYLATNNNVNSNFGLASSGITTILNQNISVSSSEVGNTKRLRICFVYRHPETVQSGHINVSNTSPAVLPLVMTVTAPNGTVYRSNFTNETLQFVSLTPSVSGNYSVNVTSSVSLPQDIRYSLVFSKHSMHNN